MQKLIFYTSTFVMVFSIAISASCQISCQEKLANSQKMFDMGDFVSSLDSLLLLQNSSLCKFSKKDKEKILVLIVRNLIELDQISKLDTFFIKILENNANYNPSKELIEEDYILHLSNHSAISKMDFSIGFGLRNTFVEKIKSYEVNENFDYLNSVYESEPETSYGFSFGYKPWKNHKLNFVIGINRMSHERIISSKVTYRGDIIPGPYEIKYDEEIKGQSLGINYSYKIKINDNIYLSPFIGIESSFIYDVEATYKANEIPNYYNDFDYPNFYNNFNESQYLTTSGFENVNEIYEWDFYYQQLVNTSTNYFNYGFYLFYRVNKISFFLNSGFQYALGSYYDTEKALRFNSENIQNLLLEKNYAYENIKLHFLTIRLGLKFNFKYKIS
tara:strand:- start:3973 stop:5136 length:1164 start_codon:yes stop_codon:yes gene_type:complete